MEAGAIVKNGGSTIEMRISQLLFPDGKLDDGNHIVQVQDCDKGRFWWSVECGAQIFLKVNNKSIQDIELGYQCSFTMSSFLFLKAYLFLFIITSFSFVH